MTKQLMISIKPEHAINILNGNKTLELRTWIPKDYKGWVYVYVRKANKNNGGYLLKKLYIDGEFEKYITSLSLDVDLAPFSILNEKILFRFWFDEYDVLYSYKDNTYNIWEPGILSNLQLTGQQIDNYGNGKTLYAWHIKQLEIFDEPKELGGDL